MINIYTLGKPCSGKSSVSHMLELEYGMVHLKVGKIVHEYIFNTYGPDSQEMLDYNKGCIIDTDQISEIINTKIQQYTKNQVSTITDGFPRTRDQFDYYYKHFSSTDIFILLDVSDKTVLERSNIRRECTKCALAQTSANTVCQECGAPLLMRADEENIQQRLDVFFTYTEYVITKLKENFVVHTIDANQDTKEVIFEKIRNIIKEK